MKKTTRQDNQEKWFLRIEDFLSREIPQSDFCQQGGFNKGTFAYWLKKYRTTTEEDAQKGFIALQASEVSSLNFGGQEVSLRRGAVELSFSSLPNLETLIPLIKALS